eukprot:1140097-Pelagomonas_calceolata.AAC.6
MPSETYFKTFSVYVAFFGGGKVVLEGWRTAPAMWKWQKALGAEAMGWVWTVGQRPLLSSRLDKPT